MNNDQIRLHLRNNEADHSPTNVASINQKEILVSIPSPDENAGLKKFADKLEEAIKSSIEQGTTPTNVAVNRNSPRKDELFIMTLSYQFPIRAIDWMTPYKERYERLLNSGNPNTDASNAILLHSEGDGTQLPSLFALSNDEIEAKLAAEAANAAPQPASAPGFAPQPAAAPGMPPLMGAPTPPITPAPQPQINLFLAIGGQQYGPYNMDTCKQLVQNGQLTPQTIVWMEGMQAWTPAGQVPALQVLFAPPAMPGVPPLPPMGGPTPRPML